MSIFCTTTMILPFALITDKVRESSLGRCRRMGQYLSYLSVSLLIRRDTLRQRADFYRKNRNAMLKRIEDTLRSCA